MPLIDFHSDFIPKPGTPDHQQKEKNHSRVFHDCVPPSVDNDKLSSKIHHTTKIRDP